MFTRLYGEYLYKLNSGCRRRGNRSANNLISKERSVRRLFFIISMFLLDIYALMLDLGIECNIFSFLVPDFLNLPD